MTDEQTDATPVPNEPVATEPTPNEPDPSEPAPLGPGTLWKIVEQFAKSLLSRQIRIALNEEGKASESTTAFRAILAAKKIFGRRSKDSDPAEQLDGAAVQAALEKLRTEVLKDAQYLENLRNSAKNGDAGPVRSDG